LEGRRDRIVHLAAELEEEEFGSPVATFEEGGTFGAAIDAQDNAWLTSYGGKSITLFDKNGKPLTPPEGITFNGQLGLMQGVIVTPSGDVWVAGIEKNQVVYFPKGDLTQASCCARVAKSSHASLWPARSIWP
jgi:hypothetical protein